MATQVYGLTAASLNAECFPTLTFGGSTAPTTTTVAALIARVAAEVNALVTSAGIDPDDVDAILTPISYQYLADTLQLGAHVRVARVIYKGQEPEAIAALAEEYQARLAGLKVDAITWLQDAATASTQDVSSHIKDLGLANENSGDDTDNTPLFGVHDET